MERKEVRELLNERITKHSQLDLLHVMENKAMDEEYSFLLKHRTAVALEDLAEQTHPDMLLIASELNKMNITLCRIARALEKPARQDPARSNSDEWDF